MREIRWTCKRIDNFSCQHSFPPAKEGKAEMPSAESLITDGELTQGQWWSKRSTQLSHRLQWEARGGRNILHVKQYFSLTVCPLTKISFVRGGGRYVGLLSAFGTSATGEGSTKGVTLPGGWHCIPICFSMNAASSWRARGMTPGSVNVVRSSDPIVKMYKKAPIIGMAHVMCTLRYGQLKTESHTWLEQQQQVVVDKKWCFFRHSSRHLFQTKDHFDLLKCKEQYTCPGY